MKRRYKEQHTFEQRKLEAERVLQKYPDRVPVICERAPFAKVDCPYIDKTKYLVPRELSVGQFMYVIRKRLKLEPHKSLFLYAGTMIPANIMRMDALHDLQQENDHFLYLCYSLENTFG